MGKFQICTSFHAFTVTASPAADANAPASRLAQRERPLREALSTSTAEQTYTCDLGSSQLVKAVHELHGNFTTRTLTYSADNVVFDPIPGASAALALDREDGYRKASVIGDFTKRYVRTVIPTQTPTDGASAFSLATVFLCANLITLGRSTRMGTAGSRTEPAEIVEEESFYFRRKMGNQARTWDFGFGLTLAQLPLYLDLIAATEDAPFLLFWNVNAGAHQEVYYLWRTGPPQDQHHGRFYREISFPVRQAQ
ncbi:MAG: hypothetical protein EWM72_02771 [Nitrospira sp.]|nr:MAG: hypothetical protein EWM72_02771 [Nitrospira sp.]